MFIHVKPQRCDHCFLVAWLFLWVMTGQALQVLRSGKSLKRHGCAPEVTMQSTSKHYPRLHFSDFLQPAQKSPAPPGFLHHRGNPTVKARYGALVEDLRRNYAQLVQPDSTFNGAGTCVNEVPHGCEG
ncbi:MAG: hypothetical protein P4L88_00230 [Rhodoferax sp.]|nr:hypothetical protein [Rhodoferax sp.]